MQTDVRKRLINSTIQIGAAIGIEKITTKGIMKDSGVNEAYIYNHFHSKNHLIEEAFLELACDIASVVCHEMNLIINKKHDRPTRNRLMFDNCWAYLMENASACRFYLRFRFSSLYTLDIHNKRNQAWQPVVDSMCEYFPQYGNRSMPIDHMIDTAIRYSSDVSEGFLENSETTADRVYQILWGVVDLDTGATK